MSSTMGPPPPRNRDENPSSSTQPDVQLRDDEIMPPPDKPAMGPPPEQATTSQGEEHDQEGKEVVPEGNSTGAIEVSTSAKNSAVPYTIPGWSGPPAHHFYFEVLKDGSIFDQFDVQEKGAFMFGRVDLCDFVLEHPTISRFHAVVQFKRSGEAYLYDLGSTHGTFINKRQVEKRVYVDLHVGDVVRFGQSSRLYLFQGPSELMPPEADLKVIRKAKSRQEILDREASLARARQDASLADGISWGMGEDAIDEEEDDADEVTWQTYKGQLTEKQEKTRDKVIKRIEKIAHMKKEIDAIRAKDIPQGGLTQGQQTQIARNEQRIAQIMEELENLEETLNESIRESLGARAGKKSGAKRKGAPEDEEDFSSEDDEFYDRTKKKPSIQKLGEAQSVETADSLLDKRDAIMKEIDDKKERLLNEKSTMQPETATDTDAGDALDAYMSGLSSQLVHDKTVELEKEISVLQKELDRILYLLKIADPTGEADNRRNSKMQEQKLGKSEQPVSVVKKQSVEAKKSSSAGKAENSSTRKEKSDDASVQSDKVSEAKEISNDETKGDKVVYTPAKPQWLGAVEAKQLALAEEAAQVESADMNETDEFVSYKDRKKILDSVDDTTDKEYSGIESAAAGLIIRKPKKVEKPGDNSDNQSASIAAKAELMAQDAVALLLKHTRGYQAEDDESQGMDSVMDGSGSVKREKKPRRVIGPEKPSFLDTGSDDDSWVPPKGQSGDGRTSLNERYGY